MSKHVTFYNIVVVITFPMEGETMYPIQREGRNPALKVYDDVHKEVRRRMSVSARQWREQFQYKKECLRETRAKIRALRRKRCKNFDDDIAELENDVDLFTCEISQLLSNKWWYGIDHVKWQ
jgi:hypothetical protein